MAECPAAVADCPAAVAKDSTDAIIWLDHIHASLSTGDRGWEYIQEVGKGRSKIFPYWLTKQPGD